MHAVQLRHGTTRTELHFIAPEEAGEQDYEVYLISDSYIGLDQQHRVRMDGRGWGRRGGR